MVDIGVNVTEKASADNPIVGLPVSTSAMVVRSKRGPLTPVKVNDLGKYRRVFGAQDPNSYAYESVKGFFDTMGRSSVSGTPAGADLWIQRVVGSGGSGSNVKAAVTFLSDTAVATAGSLSSGATAYPVAVVNGDTFITQVDGAGGPFTKTVVANQATLTLTGGSYAAGAGGESVTISRKIGGVTITGPAVDLSTATDQASYAALLNGVTGIKAVVSGSDIILTVDQAGSGSAGNITAISGASVTTKLGASVAAFTLAGGSNVANQDQMTAAEHAAMLATAGSTFTVSADGRQLTWTSNTTGDTSSVQFTGGTGVTKITGFDILEHSGDSSPADVDSVTLTDVGFGSEGNKLYALPSKQDQYIGGLSAQVASGSRSSFTLTASAAAFVTVGDTIYFVDSSTAATGRGYVTKVSNGVVTIETAVTLSANLTTATTKVYLETWSISVYLEGVLLRSASGLRMSSLSVQNYFVTRLNTGDDEQQVTASDEAAPVGADNRPVAVIATGDFFTGGSEDTSFLDVDWIGDSTTTPEKGIYGFDVKPEIRRIAIPGVTGITTAAVSIALLNYCNNRKDCRAVLDVPLGTAQGSVTTYAANLPGLSYGSLYYPWIKVLDELTGQPAFKPPCGFVMGANARTNASRNIAKAPAGTVDGLIPSALGLEVELTPSTESTLQGINCNYLKVLSAGVTIYLSRTLQKGKSGVSQNHVRDTLIYFKTSMEAGTLFVFMEPNTATTRDKVKREIDRFLSNEFAKGNLDGADTTQAYRVICDESNNPAWIQAEQKVICDVWVNIPNTTELLQINLNPNAPPAVN